MLKKRRSSTAQRKVSLQQCEVCKEEKHPENVRVQQIIGRERHVCQACSEHLEHVW